MRLLGRQFSAFAKNPTSGAPLVTFEKTAVYPLGETVTPYFKELTWRINESETWAVVGPSSSSRRVLLEVHHTVVPPIDQNKRSFRDSIGVRRHGPLSIH